MANIFFKGESDNSGLFLTLIGGRGHGVNGPSLIEQFDVRFLIGPKNMSGHKLLELFWNDIRGSWPEATKTLHIDSIMSVNFVDGHKIIVRKDNRKSQEENKNKEALKLYFLSIGRYIEGVFGEQQSFEFAVASSVNEAKNKIKQSHDFFHDESTVKSDERNGPNPHIDSSHSFFGETGDVHRLINLSRYIEELDVSIECQPLSATEKKENQEKINKGEQINPITHTGFLRKNQ